MAKDTKAIYTESVGKRKTAIARVRFFEQSKTSVTVNDKELKTYFPTEELRSIVLTPFSKTKPAKEYLVSAHIKGGGIHAQAEALRNSIAKAMVKIDQTFRKPLKKEGFLTRDSRMKERRKFGLRKARRAPQWSKR